MKVGTDGLLVLAFHAHARGFSYVVFEGAGVPVDWGMADVARKFRVLRCQKRLSLLLDRYRPDVLVIKGLSAEGEADERGELRRALTKVAESRTVATVAISRGQIRSAFGYVGSPTRFAIAKAIAKDIPTFAHFAPAPTKIWNGEDRRMALFDAIAMALTFYQMSEPDTHASNEASNRFADSACSRVYRSSPLRLE